MKKIFVLAVSVLALALLFAGCSEIANITTPGTTQEGFTYLTKGGPTEEEADSFPLYAGQSWEVGEVLVWNDGEKVCVKYVLDSEVVNDGWGLTETHLFIGTSEDDIPTNTVGNPQVGHFPYGDDGLDGAAEDGPYCVFLGEEEGELDVECGETLVIAAHAVIEKCITVQDTLVPELTWMRSSEEVGEVAHFYGYGAQWTKEQGFAITTPNSFVWDGGTSSQNDARAGVNPSISYATWEFAYGGGELGYIGEADLRRFNATFNIPEGVTIVGGNLESANIGYDNKVPINDNIYIFINENLLFWGGTIINAQGPTNFEGINGLEASRGGVVGDRDPAETDGWFILGTIPDIDEGDFSVGENNLDVFTEEYSGWGAMHELVLVLQVEKTTCESESAWGAVEEGLLEIVEGKSWGTYFEYTVECPCLGCPGITTTSSNIEVLTSAPSDVSVNALVDDDKIRVWKEFEGPLPEDLYYDLDESIYARDYKIGDTVPEPYIEAGTPVCIYYVHYDQIGNKYTSTYHPGGLDAYIEFSDDILGLIISGGVKGSFGNRNLMFTADGLIGNSGTIYPENDYDPIDTSKVNYARGFEIYWSQNTDNAVFNDNKVDFNVWVAEAHDSFRVILPLVEVPCE